MKVLNDYVIIKLKEEKESSFITNTSNIGVVAYAKDDLAKGDEVFFEGVFSKIKLKGKDLHLIKYDQIIAII